MMIGVNSKIMNRKNGSRNMEISSEINEIVIVLVVV